MEFKGKYKNWSEKSLTLPQYMKTNPQSRAHETTIQWKYEKNKK
jgi:hypothetical protein